MSGDTDRLAQELTDLGVELLPGDRHLIAVVCGCGHEVAGELESLLTRVAARVPTQRRSGLPPWIETGVEDRRPCGAWWYCRPHRMTVGGFVDEARARAEAARHLERYHDADGGAR